MVIPIINPEELNITELSELSEEIKKEEKQRKKREKEYQFTSDDIKELNRRLAAGEDLDEIEKSISEKGAVSLLERSKQVQPVIKPVFVQPKVEPPITKIEEVTGSIPEYLLERERKRKKREEKRAIKTDVQEINYPPGECCSNVCSTLNKEIGNYIRLVSPNKDEKLMFDTLIELRRQFFINEACQCANGHTAERSGVPLLEKQPEDCCPKVCETLNNSIDEYESILLPSHRIRVISDTLFDIRSKFFKNNACQCVENESQLKRSVHGGPGIDPVLQNKLSQLVKYAERHGWVR